MAANNGYNILSRHQTYGGWKYEVFSDSGVGFGNFCADYAAEDIAPGSEVDIADLQTVMRLRNDGEWESRSYYGTGEAPAAEEITNTIAEQVLNDLISDEDIGLTEEESA